MGSRAAIKEISLKDLHLGTLPRSTKVAFEKCTAFDFLDTPDWYLAGGTALALQVGHRQSHDLDFFTTRSGFDEAALERKLKATGEWTTSLIDRGTMYGELSKTKMSFIAYPFFNPAGPFVKCGAVRMLAPADVAAMKILAISQRGKKRDFVDLYWYCSNREPLADVIQRAIRQYPGQERNRAHIVKSTVYFADAETDPMPKVFFKVSWKMVKTFFGNQGAALSKKLLGA